MEENQPENSEKDLIDGFVSSSSDDIESFFPLANRLTAEFAIVVFSMLIFSTVARFFILSIILFSDALSENWLLFFPISFLSVVWFVLRLSSQTKAAETENLIIEASSYSSRRRWLDGWIFAQNRKSILWRKNVASRFFDVEPFVWLGLAILLSMYPSESFTGFGGGGSSF